MSDTVYHSALRFVSNCKPLTHHYTLYTGAGWPCLTVCRLSHWYLFIYKSNPAKLTTMVISVDGTQWLV